MFDKKYLYEFDPSGGLAANRITDELHIINPASGSDYDVIIPSFAPFFRKGLVVKHLSSGQTLTEGVHFDLGYRFVAASKECETPIYGAIVITDRTLSGSLSIDYQTLGGEWVLDTQEIQVILANIKNDPRTVKWEDIIDKPITFPPVEHLHHSDDLVGMDDVVKGIDAVREAIGDSAAKAMTALLEHIRDHANPHVVSLAQLGLDELGSLTEATDADIDAGTDFNRYVSSRRLQHFFTSKVQPAVDAHANREDNPHGVDKDDVGLGLVANYRMATLPEALEGTLSNRYMSPQLTDALVRDRIVEALHEAGNNAVTKESIGLGLVENYPPATFEQAVAGTHNASVMTPERTAQHTSNAIAAAIQAHLDQDNPHRITARTVGLENVRNYGIATPQELTEGTVDNKYVTVAGVTAMMQSAAAGGVGKDLDDHIKDKTNPHGVTKDQVDLGQVANYPPATGVTMESEDEQAYVTPRVLFRTLWDKLTARVMDNAKVGDVGFVNGDKTTGGFEYGQLISRSLRIAVNAEELNKLKTAKEDFASVFKYWKRFSILGNLVNPNKPAELNGWKYDEGTKLISSTINSETNIGFVSPKSYSDYVLEVRCTSSDEDDDTIGVVLGMYEKDGEMHTLMAHRTCGGWNTAMTYGGKDHSMWIVGVNIGTTKQRLIYDGHGGLKWPDTGKVDDNRAPGTDVGTPVGGWGAFKQGVKIRAVRTENTITVECTDLNSETYVPTSKVTIDLTSNPDLAGFLNQSPFGYCAMSQRDATWDTITRPDDRAPIFDMGTSQVLMFDGNDWTPADQPDEVLQVGRIYHTVQTGKTHFCDVPRSVILIADLGGAAGEGSTGAMVSRSSASIRLSGDGTAANPLVAELTGTTPDVFHSDVDITAGK